MSCIVLQIGCIFVLQNRNQMTIFNNSFYQPNRNYTIEMAESRLNDLGYKNYSFNSSCYTNGASFYFTSENGETIRVSDHELTGCRAFNTIQVSLIEKPKVSIFQRYEIAGKMLQNSEISKSEYKSICKEIGMIPNKSLLK